MTHDHALAIDARWPVIRPGAAPEHLWRWLEIRYSCVVQCRGEAWVYLDDDGIPAAAWASGTPLSRRKLYVLDYFEVAPDSRCRGIGGGAFRTGVLPVHTTLEPMLLCLARFLSRKHSTTASGCVRALPNSGVLSAVVFRYGGT